MPDSEQKSSGLSASVIRAVPREDGSSIIQAIPEQVPELTERIELPHFEEAFLHGIQNTQNEVLIIKGNKVIVY